MSLGLYRENGCVAGITFRRQGTLPSILFTCHFLIIRSNSMSFNVHPAVLKGGNKGASREVATTETEVYPQ